MEQEQLQQEAELNQEVNEEEVQKQVVATRLSSFGDICFTSRWKRSWRK